MTGLVWLLTLMSALGAGLMSGVFFAYSTSVVRALGRLPDSQAISGMQAINVVIINPWFMTAFLGTAAACCFVGIWSWAHWGDRGTLLLASGSMLYLVGALAVTVVVHVPMNESLAAIPAEGDLAVHQWASYYPTWVYWNHLRGLAATGAATLLTFGFGRLS